MKTIEIAPSLQNTHILHDNMIIGRMKDGSRTFVYDLPKNCTFPRKGRKDIKHTFSCAIAMASKKSQAENVMNFVFGKSLRIFDFDKASGVLTIINGSAHWLK